MRSTEGRIEDLNDIGRVVIHVGERRDGQVLQGAPLILASFVWPHNLHNIINIFLYIFKTI